MNKIILMGRLVDDTEIRYTTGEKTTAIANFRFAVNRKFVKENDEVKADFFKCVAFGKIAETFEKCNIGKGTKLLIEGEIRNDNYEKDGVKHYGMQVLVSSFEFCESKGASDAGPQQQATPQADNNGFMTIPEGLEEELPFA